MTNPISQDRLDAVRAEAAIETVLTLLDYLPEECPFCAGGPLKVSHRIAHCQECKWTGDVFRIWQQLRGVTFAKAVEQIEYITAPVL